MARETVNSRDFNNRDKTEPIIKRQTVLRVPIFLLLLVLVALLLVPAACREPQDAISAVDSTPAEGVGDEVRALAEEVAIKWLGSSSGRVADFTREMVDAYARVKNKHFAIIYNTGGFGGTSIDDDPEWSEVVYGMQGELARLGYNATVLDYTRSTLCLPGFIGEMRDLDRNYAGKAPLLAGKVDFLTRAAEDLKVIITGRCFGAIYSNEVMGLLEGNQRVYSVQAGHPFWYRPPPATNTLLMEGNGLVPDSISHGNLWAILRANLAHGPSFSRPPPGGSIKIGPIFIRAPGHEYTWGHPGVREYVIAFLEEHFGYNTASM